MIPLKFNYERFNCNNFNIRYWSWNYRGCSILGKCFRSCLSPENLRISPLTSEYKCPQATPINLFKRENALNVCFEHSNLLKVTRNPVIAQRALKGPVIKRTATRHRDSEAEPRSRQ
ncbi:hypothetical protein PCHDS_000559700, partial [Plasmodium chabaudi adami]